MHSPYFHYCIYTLNLKVVIPTTTPNLEWNTYPKMKHTNFEQGKEVFRPGANNVVKSQTMGYNLKLG